ncbi:MAG: hypothetical protein L3V56_05465 [Candidatus Magnetoovum sp. WYHC-5]|nr:hypothetical protein [Candidatus Magnetoovum sp. WYHC-5]
MNKVIVMLMIVACIVIFFVSSYAEENSLCTPLTDETCLNASYDRATNTFLIPCLTIDDGYYVADFTVEGVNPLKLTFDDYQSIEKPENTGHCANLDNAGTMTIPSDVTISNGMRYSTALIFKVLSYDPLILQESKAK